MKKRGEVRTISTFMVVMLTIFMTFSTVTTAYADTSTQTAQKQVVIKDKMLEQAIRKELHKPEGTITKSDMEQLTSLNAPMLGIKDLSGIEYAVHINYVDLNDNKIADISPLEHMHINYLDLSGNKLKNTEVLSHLIYVDQLDLSYTGISDVSFITNMKFLKRLDLAGNNIIQLPDLNGLDKLYNLVLQNNKIEDISFLEPLRKLSYLNIINNRVKDISVLEKLPSLQDIVFTGNQITDISVLSHLINKKLYTINLDRNEITDIGPLVDLAKKGMIGQYDNKSIPTVNVEFNHLDVTNKSSKAYKDIQSLLKMKVNMVYDVQKPEITSDTAGIYGTITFMTFFNKIKNATVAVYNEQEELVKKATTNAEGAFSISGLPSGIYSLKISREGQQISENSGIKLEAGKIKYLQLYARTQQFTVFVHDANGNPIPDYKIHMTGNNNVYDINIKQSSSGKFFISHLDPGKYLLTIQADGFRREIREIKVSGFYHVDITLYKDTDENYPIKVQLDDNFYILKHHSVEENGVRFVPLKEILDLFPIKFIYNGKNKVITVTNEDKKIQLYLKTGQVLINGEEVQSAKFKMIDGTTMITLDLLREMINADVKWDDESKTLVINTSQIVKISDKYLKEAILAQLNQIGSREVTTADLEKLTELDLSYYDQIRSLEGLEYAINLEKLNADSLSSFMDSESDIKQQLPKVDLKPIANLKKLKSLNLENANVVNYDSLKSITNLEYLNIGWSTINDYSFLQYLTNLKMLILEGSNFKDATFIKNLDKLESLNLSSTFIKGLSPLTNLTNLKKLYLNINFTKNIAPLKDLKNLEELYLNNNEIEDITPLSQLSNLKILDLSYNKVVDITPLAQLTKLEDLELDDNKIMNLFALRDLKSLETLTLYNNNIINISPLSNLNHLKVLALGGNSKIRNYKPISNLKSLEGLYLSGNNIFNISFLENLTNLAELDLSDNNISNILPLAQLTNLEYLNLKDNPVTDFSPVEKIYKLTDLIKN